MRSKLSVSVYFFLALYNCTFFSGSNFFWSYISTIIGTRVKIRTPITTKKNYDPKKKKGTVVWPAMFFEPTEKYITQKKGTVV